MTCKVRYLDCRRWSTTVISESENLTKEEKQTAIDDVASEIKNSAAEVLSAEKLTALTSTIDTNATDSKAAVPDDPAPTTPTTPAADNATVTIADVSVAEADDNTTATITLTLDKAVSGGFTVDVSTTDVTATAGSDYVALSSQTVTFAGTAAESENVTITIIGDLVAESTETFTVSMSNASKDNITISDTATVTVTDNDTPNVEGGPVITNAALTGTGSVYDNGTDNLTYWTPNYPPSLFFTSTEAGTLTLSTTTCVGSSNAVASGNNTIALVISSDVDNYTCSFTVTDAGGETSNSTIVSAHRADARWPSGDVVINNGNSTVDNLSAVPISINNVYDEISGFYGYYVTDNSSESNLTAFDNITFTQAANRDNRDNNSFTFSVDPSLRSDNATIPLYFYLKDNAGNVSPVTSQEVQIPVDNVSPTFTSLTVDDIGTSTDNATFTDETTVELTLTALDNDTGLVDWFARTNDNTTPSGTETTGWNKFVNDNLTVTYTLDNGTPGNALSDNLSISQTSHTVYAWVRDGGGNITPDNTTNVTDSIILDTIHPTLRDNATPPVP